MRALDKPIVEPEKPWLNSGSQRITLAIELKPMLRRSVQLRLRYGIGDEPPTHPCGRWHLPLYVADRLVLAWRKAGIPVAVEGDLHQRRVS